MGIAVVAALVLCVGVASGADAAKPALVLKTADGGALADGTNVTVVVKSSAEGGFCRVYETGVVTINQKSSDKIALEGNPTAFCVRPFTGFAGNFGNVLVLNWTGSARFSDRKGRFSLTLLEPFSCTYKMYGLTGSFGTPANDPLLIQMPASGLVQGSDSNILCQQFLSIPTEITVSYIPPGEPEQELVTETTG
jgi:hypothetical protein